MAIISIQPQGYPRVVEAAGVSPAAAQFEPALGEVREVVAHAVSGASASALVTLAEFPAITAHALGSGIGKASVGFPSPTGEPLYDSGIHTLVWDEDFEAYPNTASLKATYHDTAENNGTINLDPTAGRSGSRCYRVDWTGGEGQVLIDAATKGYYTSFPNRAHCYVSYWFKTSAGFVPASEMKTWVVDQGNYYDDGRQSRMLFLYSGDDPETDPYPGECSSNPDGHLDIECPDPLSRYCRCFKRPYFVHYASNPPSCIHVRHDSTLAGLGAGTGCVNGSRSPVNYISNGDWHRYTFWWLKESAPQAGNGIAKAWCDGELIIDQDGTDITNAAYGKCYTGKPWPWGTSFKFPSTLNPGGPTGSVYYDEMYLYYKAL